VVFVSDASDIPVVLPADSNGLTDAYLVTVRKNPFSAASAKGVSINSAGTGFGNGRSTRASISADGRFVAFASEASNLIAAGTDTNGFSDIFVRGDMIGPTPSTSRVSVSSAGSESSGASLSPSISQDGRWVSFQSEASSLVPGDTNAATDVFVHDRTLGATERVSVSLFGEQSDSDSFDPSLSADGRTVTFFSSSTNLVPPPPVLFFQHVYRRRL